MAMQLNLEEPGYYLERIASGCILDPSVFYSEDYVDATTQVMSLVKPAKIYLPSNLFVAFKKASWSAFLSTLTLWSGNYEKLSDAWYRSDSLMKELTPIPIEISEHEEKVKPLFEAMAENGKLSPLNRVVFEVTACSLIESIPIYVGSHSKFRLLELLNSKLQTVVVDPLGDWAKQKKEYLEVKGGRRTIFALQLMGGAFVFIESVATGNIMGLAAGGSVVLATVINGSR